MTRDWLPWNLPGASSRVRSLVRPMRVQSDFLSPLTGVWQLSLGGILGLLFMAGLIAIQPTAESLLVIVALVLFGAPTVLPHPPSLLQMLPLTPGDLLRSRVQVAIEWALAWALVLVVMRILFRGGEWEAGGSERTGFLFETLGQVVVLVGAVVWVHLIRSPQHRHARSSESRVALIFQGVASFAVFLEGLGSEKEPRLRWVAVLALAGGLWIVGSTLHRAIRAADRAPALSGRSPLDLFGGWWAPVIVSLAVGFMVPWLGLPSLVTGFFVGLSLWQLWRSIQALPNWWLVGVRACEAFFGVALAGLWWALSAEALDRGWSFLAIAALVLLWHVAVPRLDHLRRSASRSAGGARRSEPSAEIQGSKPSPQESGGQRSRPRRSYPNPVPTRRSHFGRLPWHRTKSIARAVSGRWVIAGVLGILIYAGGSFGADSESVAASMLLTGVFVAYGTLITEPPRRWLQILPLRPVELAHWQLKSTLLLSSIVVSTLVVVHGVGAGFFGRPLSSLSAGSVALLVATAIYTTASRFPTQGEGLSLARMAVGMFQGSCVLAWRTQVLSNPEVYERWGLATELVSWGLVLILIGATVRHQLAASAVFPSLIEKRSEISTDMTSPNLGFLVFLAGLFWLLAPRSRLYPALWAVVICCVVVLIAEQAGLWEDGNLDRPKSRGGAWKGLSIAVDLAGVMLFAVVIYRNHDSQTDTENLRFQVVALAIWIVFQGLLDRFLLRRRVPVATSTSPWDGKGLFALREDQYRDDT